MRERGHGTVVVMVGSMLASFPSRSAHVFGGQGGTQGIRAGHPPWVAPYGIRMISFEPGTIATGIGGRRSVHIGENSPYADEYAPHRRGQPRHNEKSRGSPPRATAAKRLSTPRWPEHPKPFYARKFGALVFLARQLLPRESQSWR